MGKYCQALYHAQRSSVPADTSVMVTFSQELLFCTQQHRLKRVRVLNHLQIHTVEILTGNFYTE